uniref:Uncharacterized protein n=1 Tax=Catagonus wagneri TaxID=51154 RepID=A0A8C3WL53_9CETA
RMGKNTNIIRPVNSHGMGPLLYFICYGVSTLIRSKAAYKTMMVDKTSCKPMDDSFARSISCREGQSIPKIRVCSSKNKTLSLP